MGNIVVVVSVVTGVGLCVMLVARFMMLVVGFVVFGVTAQDWPLSEKLSNLIYLK